MNTMAPTRTADLQSRRVRLVTGPAAVPEARSQVRAAIRSWKVPVDPDTAVLLTSELVTNAIRHETGPAVVLVITRSCGELRVDVHDTSHCLPEMSDIPADAETGRGLLLVGTLSTEWGFYRTPAGKAVYFTLACQARPSPRGRRVPPAADSHNGTANRDGSCGSPSAPQRSCDPRGAGTSAQ
jgi:anti-sigma regulatory factor (Ser/Thr protein kinase)